MPRGAVVSEEVKRLVGSLLNKGEKMTGKELKNAVEDEIKGINYTVRTYQNIKEELRPALIELKKSGLDIPWHIGVLIDYPNQFPPETIPDILAVKKWGEEHPENIFGLSTKPLGTFTIRQALWVSRLYGITCLWRDALKKGKIKEIKGVKPFDLDSWLWQWSEAYAQYEILCKLTGTNPDTSRLDKGIWGNGIPISMENAVDIVYPDEIEHAIFIEPDKEILNQIYPRSKEEVKE
jgi:hypothetical protein